MVRSRDPPEEPVAFNEHENLDHNDDEDDASIEIPLPSSEPVDPEEFEHQTNGDHPTDEVVPETPKDAKQEKAEKKRLEKEAKEQEKLQKAEEKRRKEEEKRQQKEEQKRMKEAAKQEKNGAKTETPKPAAETPTRKLGPPGFLSPLRAGGQTRQKGILGRVMLLDGSEMEVMIDKAALGKVLLNEVCDHLSIEERDYFGFMYTYINGDKYWLNHDRKITDQIRNGQWIFEFGVKFYPPEPKTLQEEITKYQLCLQLRDDILSQRLPCSPVAGAILGSFTVQSELGDYDPAEHGHGIDYLQDLQFCPGQTDDLLKKIADLHRSDRCRGRTPTEAEMAFLESAKKLDLYGVHLCPAKDSDRFDIFVGVSAGGIHVYRDRIKVSRFPWPMVLKMKYYDKDFYVRIRPSEFERYENSVGFRMESHMRAKRFWRLCVEHHTFFRLKEPMDVSRSMFSRFGSTRNMLFSGNTLYQSTHKKIYRSEGDPQFERSFSCRSLASRSFANNSYVEKRRSATLEGRPGRNTDDNWQSDYATIEDQNQIAVVAGTAHDTSRVAYVKTVRPDVSTGEHRVDPDDMNWTNNGRYQNTRDITSPTSDLQQLNLEDQSPTEENKKKKKKKKRISKSNDENAWPVEQQQPSGEYDYEMSVERRTVTAGHRDDIDHDAELSRAIFSVTDMNADLSVNKIEINPSDVARSMTNSTEGPIEIAPAAKPKKTKKKTKREPVPA